jgi:3-phytase
VVGVAVALILAAATFSATPAAGVPTDTPTTHDVRVATFNASLNRGAAGQLRADLSTPDNAQARTIAEIIQRTRPDVLLINEFDFDVEAARLFQDNYLSIGQNGASPIVYAHRFIAASNTGVASGFDLNNDGRVVTQPGARVHSGGGLTWVDAG